MMIIIIIN